MRRICFGIVVTVMVLSAGCHRKRTLSDFPLSPTLTIDDLISAMGTPTRTASSNYWAAYTLADNTELRLYFINGPKGSNRTLGLATIYAANGTRIKDVFKYELPTTAPASEATTAPSSDTKP